jgi:hypothetical protein
MKTLCTLTSASSPWLKDRAVFLLQVGDTEMALDLVVDERRKSTNTGGIVQLTKSKTINYI